MTESLMKMILSLLTVVMSSTFSKSISGTSVEDETVRVLLSLLMMELDHSPTDVTDNGSRRMDSGASQVLKSDQIL